MEIGKASFGLTRFPQELKIRTNKSQESPTPGDNPLQRISQAAADLSNVRIPEQKQVYNARGVLSFSDGAIQQRATTAEEPKRALEALSLAGEKLIAAGTGAVAKPQDISARAMAELEGRFREMTAGEQEDEQE